MKTAVLLLSMGGPASLSAVRPFLFNLFNDPAILRMPCLPRLLLAAMISFLHTPAAKKNYKKMGGKSPLLENTQKQAAALLNALSAAGDYRCFVGMSYAPPFIRDTMKAIKAFDPDSIVLLPLYPQFSSATTASVLRDALQEIENNKMENIFIITAPPFFDQDFFVEGMRKKTQDAFIKMKAFGSPKVLFSAHGLPLSFIRSGDPYEEHCKKNMDEILRSWEGEQLVDPCLCYQSRVGASAWLSPYTLDEMILAARTNRPIVVVPLSFVSEHVETIVELSMDYKNKALKAGSPAVEVVQTVSDDPVFIEGLAKFVLKSKKMQEKPR